MFHRYVWKYPKLNHFSTAVASSGLGTIYTRLRSKRHRGICNKLHMRSNFVFELNEPVQSLAKWFNFPQRWQVIPNAHLSLRCPIWPHRLHWTPWAHSLDYKLYFKKNKRVKHFTDHVSWSSTFVAASNSHFWTITRGMSNFITVVTPHLLAVSVCTCLSVFFAHLLFSAVVLQSI